LPLVPAGRQQHGRAGGADFLGCQADRRPRRGARLLRARPADACCADDRPDDCSGAGPVRRTAAHRPAPAVRPARTPPDRPAHRRLPMTTRRVLRALPLVLLLSACGPGQVLTLGVRQVSVDVAGGQQTAPPVPAAPGRIVLPPLPDLPLVVPQYPSYPRF